MAKLVKVIDNNYVQIEEYKSTNICFNTNKYSDFEDYCILRETFDPFKMFYENEELKKQIEEYKDKIDWYENFEVNKTIDKLRLKHNIQQKEFISYLKDEIKNIESKVFNLPIASSERNYLINLENKLTEILQKYKEIIGVSDENN